MTSNPIFWYKFDTNLSGVRRWFLTNRITPVYRDQWFLVFSAVAWENVYIQMIQMMFLPINVGLFVIMYLLYVVTCHAEVFEVNDVIMVTINHTLNTFWEERLCTAMLYNCMKQGGGGDGQWPDSFPSASTAIPACLIVECQNRIYFNFQHLLLKWKLILCITYFYIYYTAGVTIIESIFVI